MSHNWKKFSGRAFTFEEFRDEVVQQECIHGEDPNQVATASLALYIHQGYIEKTMVGQQTWYIRTGKQLPPPKKVMRFE